MWRNNNQKKNKRKTGQTTLFFLVNQSRGIHNLIKRKIRSHRWGDIIFFPSTRTSLITKFLKSLNFYGFDENRCTKSENQKNDQKCSSEDQEISKKSPNYSEKSGNHKNIKICIHGRRMQWTTVHHRVCPVHCLSIQSSDCRSLWELIPRVRWCKITPQKYRISLPQAFFQSPATTKLSRSPKRVVRALIPCQLHSIQKKRKISVKISVTSSLGQSLLFIVHLSLFLLYTITNFK